MAVRYELAVGLNKGHKTTKIRRVTYKGDKKLKGLRGTNMKNVSVWKFRVFVCARANITSLKQRQLRPKL